MPQLLTRIVTVGDGEDDEDGSYSGVGGVSSSRCGTTIEQVGYFVCGLGMGSHSRRDVRSAPHACERK